MEEKNKKIYYKPLTAEERIAGQKYDIMFKEHYKIVHAHQMKKLFTDISASCVDCDPTVIVVVLECIKNFYLTVAKDKSQIAYTEMVEQIKNVSDDNEAVYNIVLRYIKPPVLY